MRQLQLFQEEDRPPADSLSGLASPLHGVKDTIEGWQLCVSPADADRPLEDGTWAVDPYCPPEHRCLVVQGWLAAREAQVRTSSVRRLEEIAKGDQLRQQHPDGTWLCWTENSLYVLADKRSWMTREPEEVLAEHGYLRERVAVIGLRAPWVRFFDADGRS